MTAASGAVTVDVMTGHGVLVEQLHPRGHPKRVDDQPGRLGAAQVTQLRELHTAARRRGQWAVLAVAVDAHRAGGVSPGCLGAALRVSPAAVHDLLVTHLPVGSHPAQLRDWTVGDWVTTTVASRQLGVRPAELYTHLRQANQAAVTCRAGGRRVWHAPSLTTWWTTI